jgi:hypothetical protein
MKICWKQLVRYLCIVPMITYVCCWHKFVEVFKSCEGRSKGCKNGWVSLQHHLLFCFFSYSFAFTFFDFFLLYKKFTPGSATSYDATRALKAFWKAFWPSCFFHHTMCHIDIILFSSRINPLHSFLFCIIRLQVTSILDILLLCNIGLYTKERCLLWHLSFFAFLSYLSLFEGALLLLFLFLLLDGWFEEVGWLRGLEFYSKCIWRRHGDSQGI